MHYYTSEKCRSWNIYVLNQNMIVIWHNFICEIALNGIAMIGNGERTEDRKMQQNWFYLELTNKWKRFNKFISLM